VAHYKATKSESNPRKNRGFKRGLTLRIQVSDQKEGPHTCPPLVKEKAPTQSPVTWKQESKEDVWRIENARLAVRHEGKAIPNRTAPQGHMARGPTIRRPISPREVVVPKIMAEEDALTQDHFQGLQGHNCRKNQGG